MVIWYLRKNFFIYYFIKLFDMYILKENEQPGVLVEFIPDGYGRCPENLDHHRVLAETPIVLRDGKFFSPLNPEEEVFPEEKNYCIRSWGAAYEFQGGTIMVPTNSNWFPEVRRILVSGEPDSEWTYRPQSEGGHVALRKVRRRYLTADQKRAIRLTPDEPQKFREQD